MQNLDLFLDRVRGQSIPSIAGRHAVTIREAKRGLSRSSKSFADPTTESQIAIEHARLDVVFEGLSSGTIEPTVAVAMIRAVECRIKLLQSFARETKQEAAQDPVRLESAAREFIAERSAVQQPMPWLEPAK